MTLATIATGTLMVLGVVLYVIAAIGLHRFSDIYARLHAATKPATVGLLSLLAAAAIGVDDATDIAKLAVIGAFQIMTSPVSSHLIGRAARRAEIPTNPVAVQRRTRPPSRPGRP